ncbi:glycosyl hydrolase family 25 [Lentilactobacillus kisonensis DSM 19906 = JCM 15041]|uniref:Glycosyl hydrolase family 25 n=1 Tax=Lentilactobacillus kisonensis DSM 19906 = JCM 15041 TaxID=1423766 RepID=A0A0R1NL67_9LACO|nr:glycosyl hydrolase family 25 [Lentilactobacillus kisonensis DSM 19906 = JCM 15041]
MLLVVVALGFFIVHWHEKQELAKYPIRGVSLNQTNGYIDFESLKSDGISFVYLKATQGATFTDDSFQSNFARSQGSQLPVGVYHYFSFSSSPKAQFKNFVRAVQDNTGSLPICLTIQYYGTYGENNLRWQTVRRNVAHLSQLIQGYYKRPIVISATYSIINHLHIQATAKRQIWPTDAQLGKPNGDATFIQVTQKQDFKMDKQVIFLPMAVYNGGKASWHRYLN